MTRPLAALLSLVVALAAVPAAAQAPTTKLRIAACARTVTTGVGAPFAVAMKMGWFKQEGLDIEIIPHQVEAPSQFDTQYALIETADLITDELVAEANALDAAKIAAAAKAYKYTR